MVPALGNWFNYLNSPDRLIQETSGGTIGITATIILVLVAISIGCAYYLFRSMKFIYKTVTNLAYIDTSEFLSIRENILNSRKMFDDLDLESEAHTFLSWKKNSKPGQTGKRRIREVRIPYPKRSIPIFLLISVFIFSAIILVIVQTNSLSSIKKQLTNFIFFTGEEASSSDTAIIYYNYTIRQQPIDTTKSILKEVQTKLQEINDVTNAQYQQAASQIQHYYPTSSQSSYFNIIYDNMCEKVTVPNCSTVLSGAFTKGVLAGSLSMISYISQAIDNQRTPNDLSKDIAYVSNVETILTAGLVELANISNDQTTTKIDQVLHIIIQIGVWVVVVSIVLILIFWRLTIKKQQNDFLESRKILSIIPITHLLSSTRMKNFIQSTSSLAFK